MLDILPDGVTKEFQLSKNVQKIYNVIKRFEQNSWEKIDYEINEYKNTIIFKNAPEKNDLIMIQYKS